MVFFLHNNNKSLKNIQQIVISTKVANLAKLLVRAIIDLVMMAKKKWLKKYFTKSKSDKECFNCRKKDYYAINCYTSNKKKPKNE